MFIKQWICKKLVSRAKLRKWFKLEDIRADIQKAAGENRNTSELICSYLSVAICTSNWGKLPWTTVLRDFTFAVSLHSPNKKYKIFSIEKSNSEESVNDDSWYSWANMLADTYGWTLEYIAKLDIDDAISLIQEIAYTDQIRKEWEWGLSDKSVSYDSRSKKSKYIPLKRPKWLQPEESIQPKAKSVKVLKSMLPVGVIYGKPEDFKH